MRGFFKDEFFALIKHYVDRTQLDGFSQNDINSASAGIKVLKQHARAAVIIGVNNQISAASVQEPVSRLDGGHIIPDHSVRYFTEKRVCTFAIYAALDIQNTIINANITYQGINVTADYTDCRIYAGC